ncbi:methyl-accepting chemotaxis protein [Paenibacillus tepidiphilus]|uniref:methyl-accepting chemotaxis protein n=1 Tax=Paenibacillus tepidiphilus TaxID=2608683 RepID=UPI001EF039DC|nr:methyl-accepting chemotaxis protein [Paenibacillus tepidiphilus]
MGLTKVLLEGHELEETEVKHPKLKMKAKTRKPKDSQKSGRTGIRGSLQRKWSLIILAITIVPLLGVMIFFMQYFGSVTKSDSEELAENVLNMNVTRIEEWLKTRTMYVQDLIAQHPEFDTANPDTIFPVIKVLEDSDKDSEGYSVINKDGLLTNMLGMTADSSTADYFLKAKETLSPVVADMSFLEALNKYIITVLVPVTDQDHQFAGAVAFSVTPDVLLEMAKGIRVGETGYGYVISGKGDYYAYSDMERIGKNISDFAAGPQMKKSLDTMLAKESGSESYKGEGGATILSYYKTIPGTSWKLVIDVPQSEVYAKVTSAQQIATAFIIVVILLVVLLSLYLTRLLVKPIKAVSAVMGKVAEGRLGERVAVNSRDEIGQMSESINEMIASMSLIVSKIDSTVAEVAASADDLLEYATQSSNTSAEITEVVREVAMGMEEQFRGSEQSARATEEMAIGLQKIAESSAQVSDQAENVSTEVENGYVQIQSTLEQMSVISHSAAQTAEQVEALTRQAEQIGHIVDVISEISNQTGLLSLNASIEAARAGEHGRGFGVVAGEVKKLAERTSESIVHIVQLIRQIQASTAEAAVSMEKSIVEIGDGMDRMKHVGSAFEHIRSSMREVSMQIQDVSAVNEQMSAGTEEITASVSDMLTIAKSSSVNAQAVAEASGDQTGLMTKVVDSAKSLTLMMNELKSEVERFR